MSLQCILFKYQNLGTSLLGQCQKTFTNYFEAYNLPICIIDGAMIWYALFIQSRFKILHFQFSQSV